MLHDTEFMIGTRAAPNIVKKRNLCPETQIRANRTLLLSGIIEGNIKILGSTDVHVMESPVTFQVVTDDFFIMQEGILGSDFLRGATKTNFAKRSIVWQNTIIPFSQRHTVIILSRSRAIMLSAL